MVFDKKDREIKPTTRIRDFFAKEPDFYGNKIFIDFVHKLFSITHYKM